MTTATTTPDTFRVLSALHAAAALKRAPRPGRPDGHGWFFSLAQLQGEGRLPGDADMTGLHQAARRLQRQGLVHHRRLHTIDFWALAEPGSALLAAELRERGLDQLAAVARALEQSVVDARAAALVAATNKMLLDELLTEHGELLPSERALLDASMGGDAL